MEQCSFSYLTVTRRFIAERVDPSSVAPLFRSLGVTPLAPMSGDASEAAFFLWFFDVMHRVLVSLWSCCALSVGIAALASAALVLAGGRLAAGPLCGGTSRSSPVPVTLAHFRSLP